LLRETDGRWIADISELPGVTVYGANPEEATVKAKALALRVIAEEIEHGENAARTGHAAVFHSRMSVWLATKARRALAALQRIGWRVVRTSGSLGP
jgi:predicted RNase H-like HicB family nuclease